MSAPTQPQPNPLHSSEHHSKQTAAPNAPNAPNAYPAPNVHPAPNAHNQPLPNSKQTAAQYAVKTFIQDRQRVGLGTGSTVEFVLQALQEAIRQNLLPHTSFYSSSARTTERCAQLGIPITDYCTETTSTTLDLVIDGADAVNNRNQLIKGGGGALLREKVLAYHSRKLIIVVDNSKLVPSFSPTSFPLPIEVVPYATHSVINHLATLRASNTTLFARVTLRTLADGTPFITDNHNHIVDANFAATIEDAAPLEPLLNNIVGVVENGLFTNATPTVVCASGTKITVR